MACTEPELKCSVLKSGVAFSEQLVFSLLLQD